MELHYGAVPGSSPLVLSLRLRIRLEAIWPAGYWQLPRADFPWQRESRSVSRVTTMRKHCCCWMWHHFHQQRPNLHNSNSSTEWARHLNDILYSEIRVAVMNIVKVLSIYREARPLEFWDVSWMECCHFKGLAVCKWRAEKRRKLVMMKDESCRNSKKYRRNKAYVLYVP